MLHGKRCAATYLSRTPSGDASSPARLLMRGYNANAFIHALILPQRSARGAECSWLGRPRTMSWIRVDRGG